MDPDPWNWTVEDVQHFFRVEGNEYISDMPHARLPPLESFLPKLSDNDVSGAVLLTIIDPATLREDCGVSSLGSRSAVLHCIGKLRQKSSIYNAQQGPHQPQTSGSLSFRADPAIPLPQDISSPPVETVGEHVRSGEIQIHDLHGRKRRKLDLTKLNNVTLGNQRSSVGLTDPSEDLGYLRDAQCAIDELFYGQTAYGKVIEEMIPIGDITINRVDRIAGLDDRNFQFLDQYKSQGECQFVYSKLRHFLQAEEAIELRRNGREAIAYLPYRQKDALQEPSATVLQFHPGEGEPVAVREAFEVRGGVIHLRTAQDIESSGRQDPGEWDFLRQKYPDDENSLLPSDFGDDEGPGTTNADDEDDDSQMAAVDKDDDDSFLNPEQMSHVFETFIAECIDKWRARLPSLENKRAWTIWKQMKRNRLVRQALIEGANAKISQLTDRLRKLQDKYSVSTWHNQESLRRACVAMEPTIEDIEELQWKISVWERKQEPHHTVNHTTQTKGDMQGAPAERALGGGLKLNLQPEDCFSASPSLMEQNATDNVAPINKEDDNATNEALNIGEEIWYENDNQGLFLTPGSSRHTSPIVPFIVDTSSEMAIDSDRAIVDGDNMVGTSDTLAADFTAEEAGSGENVSFRAEGEEHESDELPDMSTLVAPAPKTPSRSRIEPIDLTMCSSDSDSNQKKRGRGRPPNSAESTPIKSQKAMLGDPGEASAAIVHAWDWEDLIEKQDRRRILMKILLEAGKPFQDRADDCLRQLKPVPFAASLRAAVWARKGTAEFETQGEHKQTVAELAPVYICWAAACHPKQAEREILRHSDDQWNSMHTSEQLSRFTSMLGLILARKKKHFATPKATLTKVGSSSAPIDLSSGLESDAVRGPIARRKRKKEVKRSVAAEKSRFTAFQRQKKFAESQTTDSAKLVAMLQSDPSVSSIEINPVKEADDERIYISNKIALKMKPHQIDGVRFMWRELTAEEGQGCILAHTMGLGKTMQTIAVLIALNESAQSDQPGMIRQLPAALQKASILEGRRAVRALVLCPPALKQNWQYEIDMWAGNKLGPISIIDSKTPLIAKLKEWKRHGGVLLVGYEHFRSLLARKLKKDEDPGFRFAEVKKLEKLLLETPEVVVADEAQNIKNDKASVSSLAKRFKTESRIALTGTPMSNDVDEIYALVNWSAPGFLGDALEFRAHFTEPIKAGLYSDSVPSDKRRSLMKLKVLHSEIEPKVNRANIEVLRGSLKSKTEFIITLPLTQVQTEIYTRFIEVITGARSEKASQLAIFGWLSDLTLLTTHPRCLRQKLLTPPAPRKKRSSSEEADLDGRSPSTVTEDESSAVPDCEVTLPRNESKEPDDLDDIEDEEVQVTLARLSPAEVETILNDMNDDTDPALSSKITVFRELLASSLACGDKVLVFSGSIPTLDYLETLLCDDGRSYGRIDGSVPAAKRTQLLERFESSDFDVMLISTRAGGVGLNIQKANRVFIMDFKWNPSVEEQAIGRAYRLGQQKPVYVYRFVTGGTFEKNLYNQQLFKTSLAQRVIDKKNPRRNATRDARKYLYLPKDVKQDDLMEEIGKDREVLDKLLKGHAPVTNGEALSMIRSINTMETLQEDEMDAPLDAEEQKWVDAEIQWMKQHGRGAVRPIDTWVPRPPPPPSSASPYFPYGPEMAGPSRPASTWQSSNHLSSMQPGDSAAPPSASYLGGLPSPRMASQPY